MKNLLDELVKTLAEDSRLVSEGKLMKNKIVELAMNLDSVVIHPLLNSPVLKAHFFKDIDGILAFDKIKFQQFVSNKSFLPDSFTSYNNKIGLVSDNKYLADSKEVVLAWPYKDCLLEGGQDIEDAKRDEIFWNETLAPDEIDRLLSPKVLVNFRRYDTSGVSDSVSADEFLNGNLIIKGNNLLALHSLKKHYSGKIKLIYIDPPYNTGGDSFNYNDRFNHSTWLTFIKNRLEIASTLLSPDGFIFISIDDNEHPYLRVICDEIFGREHFVSDIIVQSNKGGRDYLKVAKSHEYVICYQKSDESEINEIEKIDVKQQYKDRRGGFNSRELRNRNPKFHSGNRPNLFYPFYINPNITDDDGFCIVSTEPKDGFTVEAYPLNSLGNQSCWRWGKPKAQANVADTVDDSEVVAKQKADGGWNIYEKHRKTTAKVKSIWDDSAVRTEAGTKELRKLLDNPSFVFPKPVELIKRIIMIATNEGDIVLDFFGGSGTTAQAVLEINQDGEERKFILTEQMEYIEDTTLPRVHQVIKNNQQGSFVYCELAKANQTFVKLIGQANTSEQLNATYVDMQNNAFLSYRVDLDAFNASKKEFEALDLAVQKAVLMEMLDKNLLYVPFTEVDDVTFGIGESDKALNRRFYGLDK